jgi:ABC-type phosphate transport system ATPase subunit
MTHGNGLYFASEDNNHLGKEKNINIKHEHVSKYCIRNLLDSTYTHFNLQILKDIHENKSLEAERELIKARKDSDERVEKSKEADSRMDKVQETLDRSKSHFALRVYYLVGNIDKSNGNAYYI